MRISVIEKNNTKKIGISVIEKNNAKKNWNICHRKKIILKKIGISVIEKNNT
jgi:hypothetical protein